MTHSPAAATISQVTHHTAKVNGADLHYVSAGTSGTPVLLTHGFPESWWTFRGVIPPLAAEHQVIAVDLPGFGDSGHGPGEYTSSFAAESVRQLIEQLDIGPVHLTGQDIGGVSTFRLAATYPELLRSYTAIETGLPGFGLEMLADGFRGATGLYRSMLTEGEDIQQIVANGKLTMPVLAVGAGTGPFTHATMTQVAENVTEANLDGIGHLAALESNALAEVLLAFYHTLDA